MKADIQFAFTERELKLIRLFLDPAAARGEIQNGAIRLAQSLRTRGVKAETIQAALRSAELSTRPSPASRSSRSSGPDYSRCKMPFGKHRGKNFSQISPDYLEFIVRWIRGNPAAPAFQLRLADKVEAYLA